ncbi:putative RNA-directed DNA polymerase, partial [Tanacetum coccineum]
MKFTKKKKEIQDFLIDWDSKAEAGLLSPNDYLKREECLSKLNSIDQKERDSLKQKSRVKWAVEGDENTKFFHSIVNKKIKDRSINGINCNGVWIEEPEEIQEAARIHFASRFKELNSNRPLFRSNLFMRLDHSDVSFLESEFTLEEVKEAVWDFLIPKNSDPDDLGDYRPISLIGCMYKVLSKLLSRRLCKVIHKLIRPNQTSFLAGRQILDGNLIANEIVNYAKKEKLKLLLFKVDFEKAFDSVNWKFLIDIMCQMGFGAKWCKWIHACLSSASISILINGYPSKEFSMERGLRKGDPLSPFLFLIIAEALQVMMIESCNKGIFKGLFLAKNDTNISLLQYVDNALFFGEWSKTNALCLVHILKCFHDVSGLKINLAKCQLFGIGVPLADVESIARSINCSYSSLTFTYLGLPVGKDMRKIEAWDEVVNCFTNRLSMWKAKLLSIEGRLTLVKAVLKSLPLYFFSIFKAPEAVISRLESIRRRFFRCKVITEIHGSKGGFDVSDMSLAKSGVWVSVVKCCSNLNRLGIDLNEIM